MPAEARSTMGLAVAMALTEAEPSFEGGGTQMAATSPSYLPLPAKIGCRAR